MAEIRSLPIREMRVRGRIAAEDIAMIRMAIADGGLDGCADAEALIGLDAACPMQVAAWTSFLADVIADFVVGQIAPEGYVNAANARWLAGAVAPGGEVATVAGLEVLVSTLARARWAPPSLARLALDQVRFAVATGTGPLRRLIPAPAGTITPEEVEWLRRILYAAAADGHVALTLPEARALAAIDDALSAERIEPHWIDLYLKAMTSVALHASGHAAESRERVLAPTAPGSRGQSVAADTAAVFTCLSAEERALAALERQRIEIVTGEAIPAGEIEWLAARLRPAAPKASVASLRLRSELQGVAARLADPLAAALAGDGEALFPAGGPIPVARGVSAAA